jgi:ABC-type transport system involved in multi-copper enzyme maturation permease subunit
MIRNIIGKEILKNLLSLRFMLSLLLIISLFATGGFMFAGKYRQESNDYWRETNRNLSSLREHTNHLYELVMYRQVVWRRPKPLSLCATGFENTLPDRFSFDPFTTDLPEVRSRSNFLIPHFSDIDWVFTISLIVSFVALLLTYDSICGEKQAGTLRLLLAGSIPRHKVLLGKYVGAMLTIGIPLLSGLMVSLIVVVSYRAVEIDTVQWLKILIIALLSFLYLSIFILSGIFISSLSHKPASSMVVLLLVWVVLVILIPSFGRIIAGKFHKIPTRLDIESKVAEAIEQIRQDSEKFGKGAGSWNSQEDNPPAAAKYYDAQVDARNTIMDEYLRQMVAQARTGRHFTCISPVVIYQTASEAVAGVGMHRITDLCQQIKRYQEVLREYIRNRDAEDSDSLHLLFQFPSDWVAENWHAISDRPVDFESVPKFHERDGALGQSLKLAVWDIGLLAIYNLVFFAASFVSFLRYDVR